MSAGREMLIGIDLGTSGCKAVLVDARGALVAEARSDYPTYSPEPGWTEQEPADWITAATLAVRALISENGRDASAIAGLSLTSAAHIGVLVDGRGEPVRRALLWSDQRTAEQVAELEHEAGADILAISAQAVSTGWTLPHLRWVRSHDPAAWSRTRGLLLSKDYLLHRLTGERATDPATALSAQLTEAATGEWSERLCDLAGVPMNWLPRILDSRDRAGVLTAEAARELGLPKGLPVVTGTLDSATELLAAGLAEAGDGLVRLATAGGVERLVAGPVPHRRRITYPHAVRPLWYCQAGTSACAASVKWARDLFGGTLSYAEWDAEAAAVQPGAEGVLFHPYLAGERAPLWDPHARGSFTGLTLGHTRGHLARAVYEGTAFSIRHAMTMLHDLPAGEAPLAVAGGGAGSALWTSILADVLGLELRLVEGADSACGAALLGLAGCGLADLSELLVSRRTQGQLVKPDPGRQAYYDTRFSAYVEAQKRLTPLYHPGPA